MLVEEKIKTTMQAYLDAEFTAKTKSEFINEKITPIPYTSINHGQIASNLHGLLFICLKGMDYRIFVADSLLFVPWHELDIENGNVYYPDLMIVDGEPISKQMSVRMTATVNPVVLIEIFSESNPENDLVNKLLDYKRIPTLQQYLIVSQDKKHIEQYERIHDTKEWRNISFTKDDFAVKVLNCELQIQNIYEKVDFDNNTV